jgi:hypothetical protein
MTDDIDKRARELLVELNALYGGPKDFTAKSYTSEMLQGMAHALQHAPPYSEEDESEESNGVSLPIVGTPEVMRAATAAVMLKLGPAGLGALVHPFMKTVHELAAEKGIPSFDLMSVAITGICTKIDWSNERKSGASGSILGSIFIMYTMWREIVDEPMGAPH